MYTKNLTEDFRLRLSSLDMDFLKNLSDERGSSVSECVRSIIGEYRRSVEAIKAIQDAINLTKGNGGCSDGNTKTDIDNQL